MHACLRADVVSATVPLSSPCSGENVEKHFLNLQTLLTAAVQPVIDESGIAEEDFVVGNPLKIRLHILQR